MSDKKLKELDVKLHNFIVGQMKFNNIINESLNCTINNQNRLLRDLFERKYVLPVCVSAFM
ncbi:hypothetical protein LCGC14_1268730 [marine sediment metagenome]|uniref:Uncharacterized protein n=1 Tax=marine sediment metagenome TaxID=412755 RepID=A0A0F9L0J8_9ZZZZ